jgi:hypothetical protein
VNLDEVRAAIAAVTADLGVPPDVPLDIGPGPDGLVALGLPDGGVHSTRLDDDTMDELLVAIAHHLQNDVNFWLPGAWGEALPPCPGHPHPMSPRVLDAAAWWTCPSTGDRVAEIGTL